MHSVEPTLKSIFSKLFSFLPKAEAPHVPDLETPMPRTGPSFAEKAQAVAVHLNNEIHGIEVTVTQDRPLVFTVRTTGSIKSKVQLLFGDLIADIDEVFVEPDLRRQGQCRRFTQELCRSLHLISFNKMTLYAVHDGRVTWAAFGFRPTRGAWKTHKEKIEKSFRAHQQEFPPEIAQDISDLISADQVSVFPLIANIEVDNQLLLEELSTRILGSLKGWHGEFDVGNERDEQYLFRGE